MLIICRRGTPPTHNNIPFPIGDIQIHDGPGGTIMFAITHLQLFHGQNNEMLWYLLEYSYTG